MGESKNRKEKKKEKVRNNLRPPISLHPVDK
jgi:hypothetical protein